MADEAKATAVTAVVPTVGEEEQALAALVERNADDGDNVEDEGDNVADDDNPDSVRRQLLSLLLG